MAQPPTVSLYLSTLASFLALAAAQSAKFEVASIKKIPQDRVGYFLPFSNMPTRSGDRVSWIADPRSVILYAYEIRPFQLKLKVPAGQFAGLYDIQAKADGVPTSEETRVMFQNLLKDRFSLTAHRETEEESVYNITVAPGGVKLRERPDPWIFNSRPVPDGVVVNRARPGDLHHLVGKKVPIATLATYLSDGLRKIVLDKTGLEGTFDIELTWSSDESPVLPPDPALVSAAMRRQLGLQLNAARAPVDILVVDRLGKPTEN